VQEIVKGDPTKVSSGSEKQFIWKCSQNHKWRTAICNRTRGSGCPKCATYGFNPNVSATFYLINNDQVIQFGITNDIKTRLAKHRRSGFTSNPIALIPFRKGANARALEVSLITEMRDHGIPTATQRGIRFDGSTEAFCIEDADEDFLEDFKALVGLT
jgi:hypothetical protein